MGTITVKIPLVTWREGRPRFFPSLWLRQLGMKGEDLRHADGTWFTVDECGAWSEAKQAEIAALKALRRGKAKGPATRAGRAMVARSGRPSEMLALGALVEDFLAHDPANRGELVVTGRKLRKGRKPSTVRCYRNAARAIERLDPSAWAGPVAACTVSRTAAIVDAVEVGAGLSTARHVRAMLSACFGWAVGRKLMAFNPVRQLERMPQSAPSVRPLEPWQVLALVAAADSLGRPDMGDLIVAGACHAQSQQDRLQLRVDAFDGRRIGWKRGKTGHDGFLPVPPWLAARLASARARRSGWKVQPMVLFPDEKTGKPFAADWYRKVFAEVRTAAGLETARDKDLRDTAAEWLRRAGCSHHEIGAVTMHGFARKEGILRSYLKEHDGAAGATAMEKLGQWMAGEEKLKGVV